MAAILGVTSATLTQQAQAFPKNPQRPMNASTCEEALARVKEAGLGSSLISPEENRKVFLDAVAMAERLCGTKKRQDTK